MTSAQMSQDVITRFPDRSQCQCSPRDDASGEPRFFQEQSRLIDELRAARTTAALLVALAPEHEAKFTSDLCSRIIGVLEDLGCCD